MLMPNFFIVDGMSPCWEPSLYRQVGTANIFRAPIHALYTKGVGNFYQNLINVMKIRLPCDPQLPIGRGPFLAVSHECGDRLVMPITAAINGCD